MATWILNRKHEMFLNGVEGVKYGDINTLNRKHEMFLNA